MPEKIGTAYVSIRARLDRLEKDLTDAKSLTTRRAQEIQTGVSNILKTAVAYVSVREIASFGKELFETGKEVARLNKSYVEITGSTAAANKEFEFLRKVSDDLGQNFYDLAEAYKGISAASKGTALEGEETRRIFTAITKASASLGLSTDSTRGALVAIQQMMSKGKISAEELRQQLGERLPGAFNLMAEAVGVTTAQLDEMLKNGEVLAADALPKLATVLEKRYSGAVDDATRASNALAEAWKDFKVNLADSGFLESTTENIQALADTIGDKSFLESIKTLGGALNWLFVSNMGDLAKVMGRADEIAGGKSLIEVQIAGITKEIEKQNALIARDKSDMGGWRGKIAGAETYQEQLEKHTAELEVMEQKLAYLKGQQSAAGATPMNPFGSYTPPTTVVPTVAEVSKEIKKVDEALADWFQDIDDRYQSLDEFIQFEFIDIDYLEVQIDRADKLLKDFFDEVDNYAKEVRNVSVDNALAFEFEDLDKQSAHIAESAKDLKESMASAFEGWGASYSRELTDMVFGSKLAFDEIGLSFAKMITQMIIQQRIMGPLMQGISGLWSGTSTPMPESQLGSNFAKGAAFDSPDLHRYANQVVNKPTFFRFATGGIFGEAGPEAIMPLKRINGKLGVEASGAGRTVVNIINNGAQVETRRRQTQQGEEIDVIVGAMIANQMMTPGTATNRAMRQSGARRQLTAR